jgi:hypothetical protein
VKNVPPHGECIVVPGDQFDPDWEAFLDEQGYGCVFTDFGEKPVTLVLTIKRHGKSERTVYEPRTEKKEPPTPEATRKGRSNLSAMKGPQWGLKDEQRLISRINELKGSLEEKCRALTKEFQERSPNAILQKYRKLVKAGLPRPGKRGRPKKVLSVPGLQKGLENVCPDCGLPKDLCCCDEEKKHSLREELRPRFNWPEEPKKKENLRREIRTHEEQIEKGLRGHAQKTPIKAGAPGLIYFETYCRKCQTGRGIEDVAVWRVCPVCLEPLIVWNVQETSS